MESMLPPKWARYAGLLVILFSACTKGSVTRQLSPPPPVVPCDTCPQRGLQIDKEVILYPTVRDWVDKGDGRFECDLKPLLAGQFGNVDSLYITAMFVGTGMNARQIMRGITIPYDLGTLAWSGFKLNFQISGGLPAPGLITLRLELIFL